MPELQPTERAAFYALTRNSDIVQSGVVSPGEVLASPWPVQSDVDENAFLGKVASLNSSYNPLPSTGEPVEAGVIYGYGSGLVICRQSHTRTAHNPADIPALFAVYRVDGGMLAWVAGEMVAVGNQRVYEDITYTCIQAHQTQFTPDLTPALWEAVATSNEWQVGVAYTIGDIVTYQGAEYQCRQSHTSQVGWEPPNVLALWLPL